MGKHLWIWSLLLLVSCDTTPTREFFRPQHPWAIRSVLDYKPRMLTLALDSTCFVAYDLVSCRFYKAWRGGVNWDGIVYNDTKTIQPSSWGSSYTEDFNNRVAWWIIKDHLKIIPHVRFMGYQFSRDQIYLSYRLTTTEDTIYIEERPEFVRTATGGPGLERWFSRKGASKTQVFLSTQSREIEIERNANFRLYTPFESLPTQAPLKPVLTDHSGKYWIEKSDCFTCHEWTERAVGPSFVEIAEKYPHTEETIQYLAGKIRHGGTGVWGTGLMNPHLDLDDDDLRSMVTYIFSLNQDQSNKARLTHGPDSILPVNHAKPGYGSPLVGVHPSFRLETLDPPGHTLRVGGLAFFPDGRLLVATWSPQGSVYILDGVETGDSSKINVKLIAEGLSEPLGAAVVDNSIFILQKQELTQLIDTNGDEVADEYRAICNEFGVSSDFHEFAFGLVFHEGHFYANLSLPMRLMSNERPLPDRGRTIKISLDGSFESLNHGLRQPNGIGIGIDEELFITDNQGQWLPANKLIHVRKGEFHGMRWGLPDSISDIEMTPPTLWLPQDEIANSPSEPTILDVGPYQNQMLFGDISHGGIKRVFLEQINSSYQGAVFRFSQGLKAGVNRMRWGPDGALYIGEAGMVGGWSWKGTRAGLQRIKYIGKSTFEMLSIKSKLNGFEITFTEPLSKKHGNDLSDYHIEQWWYQPTANYGGPKMDLTKLAVQKVRVSEDRKTVYLNIPGLKAGHLVYFRLNDQMASASDQPLWSSEAWYTLNAISNQPL